jgi:hypothetical protein
MKCVYFVGNFNWNCEMVGDRGLLKHCDLSAWHSIQRPIHPSWPRRTPRSLFLLALMSFGWTFEALRLQRGTPATARSIQVGPHPHATESLSFGSFLVEGLKWDRQYRTHHRLGLGSFLTSPSSRFQNSIYFYLHRPSYRTARCASLGHSGNAPERPVDIFLRERCCSGRPESDIVVIGGLWATRRCGREGQRPSGCGATAQILLRTPWLASETVDVIFCWGDEGFFGVRKRPFCRPVQCEAQR